MPMYDFIGHSLHYCSLIKTTRTVDSADRTKVKVDARGGASGTAHHSMTKTILGATEKKKMKKNLKKKQALS